MFLQDKFFFSQTISHWNSLTFSACELNQIWKNDLKHKYKRIKLKKVFTEL